MQYLSEVNQTPISAPPIKSGLYSEDPRERELEAIRLGAGMVGFIGGVIYARKTGKGFFRAWGYGILGGLLLGLPVRALTLPPKKK